MKKFKFALDPLLEVRKRKEEAVKLEMGSKNREILKANQEMLDIHDELKNLQSEEKERRKHGTDVQSMRLTVVYRNKLAELVHGKIKANIANPETPSDLAYIQLRFLRASHLLKAHKHSEALAEIRLALVC